MTSDARLLVEIRQYEVSAGRLGDLMRRFEEVVCPIFEELSFDVGPGWTSLDANTEQFTYLMYWVNEAALHAGWSQFLTHPKWLAAKAAEGSTPIVASWSRRLAVRDPRFPMVRSTRD